MRRRYLLASIVLVVGILCWTLLRKKSESPTSPVEVQNPPQKAFPQTASAVTPALAGSRSRRSNPVVVEGTQISEEALRYVENVKADPQYDWKQPINFYGKVVDENNEAVEGASVDFKWTDLSPNGTSQYQTTSDSTGLFSLVNQTGKRLSVTVSKLGYYGAADARMASFEYANPADGLFTPDPNSPVVLHLRKKGTGVDLITSQSGMSPDFPFNIPRDGTPVILDLMQRRIGGGGQIQISENKPGHDNWRQATSWWFRMEIPDGGFVEQNDEFPFEAPEGVYQPVVQFDFQQGQTNWATGVKQDFYIKFGNPPRYGRFQVQTDISYGGAIITYAINPDGSRTLEPK